MNDFPKPAWVEKIRSAYLSGGSSLFILHGNIMDLVGTRETKEYQASPLADYLSERLFANYDLVLHYDVGRGLRCHPGSAPRRLTGMNSFLAGLLGSEAHLPREATPAMRFLDRLVSLLLVGDETRQKKVAILFDYADLLCPPGDREPEHLATFQNWARSSVIRRVNLLFVLMTESLGQLHPALVQSPHTDEVHIPMPRFEDRQAFVESQYPTLAAESEQLARQSAGLMLANLDNMIRLLLRPATPSPLPQSAQGDIVKPPAPDQPTPPPQRLTDSPESHRRIAEIKKTLIEAQCPGLLEFVQPRFTLDLVAGHTAARERLAQDARLLREGRLEAVPMGYLICGPVGSGKTFLAQCYAGSVGIPCVVIRNFRSKYVGETESNLERILTVLRELGPVAVIVDEADAAVGNREASGDSGTSARVFAQLAAQMGNTEYRGRMIWFLLTCRPDLLPVDLKRQGRCEEHIPLFYPEGPDEIREMFLAMARKMKISLPPENLPDFSTLPPLSGADIEGVLTRARRESFLRNAEIDAALLNETLRHFRATRGPAHELQMLAAILECTDLRYLPEKMRLQMQEPAGPEVLARRFHELQILMDEK